MNRCPKCNEPVLDVAVNCRKCGEPIDEKTFFLSEDSLLQEVRQAAQEAEQKIHRQRRQRKIAQAVLIVGLCILGVGVGFLLRESLPPWVALGGLVVTGVGIALMAVARRSKD